MAQLVTSLSRDVTTGLKNRNGWGIRGEPQFGGVERATPAPHPPQKKTDQSSGGIGEGVGEGKAG